MPDTLSSTVCGVRPFVYSRPPQGHVLMANGVDKAQRWDGVTDTLENAGIPRAAQGTFAASSNGSGSINGAYSAIVRYLDDADQPGDASTAISFTATNDANVDYTNIPVSTESRVTKRQIYRSTAGQIVTYYLDVEIPNNVDTSTTTTNTDAQLLGNTALPILNADGTLNARRFGVPPDFKKVVVSHQDRSFWMVDDVTDEGHAELTNASATALIVGGKVTDQMVGRKFYPAGSTTVYNITAVSESANTVQFAANFGGTTNLFSRYAIRPDISERNLMYYSEKAEPESVPSVNATRLLQEEDDGSELAGAISLGSFIWPFTPQRLYRWTFQNHPVNDGGIYPSAHRGCLNQNCFTQVEGVVYAMDRAGIYRFSGGSPDYISDVIHDFFREAIVWDNAARFHAEAFETEETVKFFVCLDGSYHPKHALCYHYRRGAWWTEEYPWEVPASTRIPLASKTQLLVGGPRETVHLAQGTLDGVKRSDTYRGTVSSATQTSLTIDTAPVAADVLGAPVSIVKGRGKGQQRVIQSVSSTRLNVDRPWLEKPDSTSEYQIGGIEWSLLTGRHRMIDTETETGRNVQVVFTPTEKAGSMDVRLKHDFSATPTNWTQTMNADNKVETVRDKPDAFVPVSASDMEHGFAWLDFSHHHDFRGPARRWLSVELRGVQNRERIQIHEITIDGVQ